MLLRHWNWPLAAVVATLGGLTTGAAAQTAGRTWEPVHNGALDRWELIGADAGMGLQDFGTGRRVGEEMHIEQQFGVTSPEPSHWRIRYYDIQPDRFSWTADRSTDGGKTWTAKYLEIEACRIGPARIMGPIAAPSHSATTQPWR